MTSTSVSDVNSTPSARSSFLSSMKFSTMPLTTMWTRLSSSKCGCALSSLTRPWVAQRVWPMPVVAGGAATATPPPKSASTASSTAARRALRLPTARTDSRWPSDWIEMPAESYPRYSSF